MKTYVLTVSRTFPKTHKRSGEPTGFTEKIVCAVFCPGDCSDCDFKSPKLHTIRSNYDLWAKRINEINEGKAILSIRYWSGKPYNSKQVELYKLEKDSGIGIQPITFMWQYAHIDYMIIPIEQVATNDGLKFEDFVEWFKKYDLSKPMAIIHFTDFRY
jgi:hypothetical protein